MVREGQGTMRTDKYFGRAQMPCLSCLRGVFGFAWVSMGCAPGVLPVCADWWYCTRGPGWGGFLCEALFVLRNDLVRGEGSSLRSKRGVLLGQAGAVPSTKNNAAEERARERDRKAGLCLNRTCSSVGKTMT